MILAIANEIRHRSYAIFHPKSAVFARAAFRLHTVVKPCNITVIGYSIYFRFAFLVLSIA